MKPKTKNFGLFRCFEPISKQPKQTELFRSIPKQTETTLNVLKNRIEEFIYHLFAKQVMQLNDSIHIGFYGEVLTHAALTYTSYIMSGC